MDLLLNTTLTPRTDTETVIGGTGTGNCQSHHITPGNILSSLTGGVTMTETTIETGGGAGAGAWREGEAETETTGEIETETEIGKGKTNDILEWYFE